MNDTHDNEITDKTILERLQAPRFSGPAEAHAYVLRHDERAKALHRMTMPTLRQIEDGILHRQMMTRIVGGPVSKDELERSILDMEFPHVAEARKTRSAGPSPQLVTQRELADELAVKLGTQLHTALTALQLAGSYTTQLGECQGVVLHPELAANLRQLAADCRNFARDIKAGL